jgi:CRISPR-associated endonuclease/helicase Cas3
MPAPDFASFFQAATGYQPYAYQCRLACGPGADPKQPATLQNGTACQSQLIDIPTGLGKTAAVVLTWLWNRRVEIENSPWPRRLVYCLPMRTLVEQTASEAKKWIENLSDAGLFEREPPKIHILMGGEETEQWDLYPEKDTILIGTQDMLLSRALNRGYGMSRYRWPMHFSLLNNDCLWVLDETQLMGVGIETSAQLDGFRTLWHGENPSPTWWMSATLEDSRLATVDHPTPERGWPRLHLEENDREKVRHRLEALKRLKKAPLAITKQFKSTELAKLVLQTHVANQLTLVIVNRVQRAKDLYLALQKQGRKDGLALVHSRFRAPDRLEHQKLLIPGKKDPTIDDRIVIATQAIEAGIDVSARVLITELAPWSSLVQRFGRCNRGGEFNTEGADIHWLDLQFEKDEDTAPYSLAEIMEARIELENLEGQSVNPEKLTEINVTPLSVIRPVIRRKDLLDLFDTTPDIAGHDLDISRYIREGDDTDVHVYWRDLNGSDGKPSPEAEAPTRAELCCVGVHRFRVFLKKLNESKDGPRAWLWDGL